MLCENVLEKAKVSHVAQIKRKINSVTTTRKITKAMRLVARSMYARMEKRSKMMDNYCNGMRRLLNNLCEQYPDWQHPVFPSHSDHDRKDTKLCILMSATRGLCGSFHNNLNNYFFHKFKMTPEDKVHFITVGSKAKLIYNDTIKKKDFNVEEVLHFTKVSMLNIEKISSEIFDYLLEKGSHYRSVKFYSNTFENFFTHDPSTTKILPISRNKIDTENEEEPVIKTSEFLCEQSSDGILTLLANKCVANEILRVAENSMMSENASRFISMDSATQSADKILDRLTLQYNRMRQGMITREIFELATTLTQDE